jgi:hypothetical protein
MTFNEFVEMIRGLKIPIYNRTSRFDDYEAIYDFEDMDLDKIFIARSWEIGGASGGSCWGTEATVYHGSEPEPEFEALDNILMELMPDIPFLRYKKLMRLIKFEQNIQRVSEYYGNYTEYQWEVVNIRNLYEALQQINNV